MLAGLFYIAGFAAAAIALKVAFVLRELRMQQKSGLSAKDAQLYTRLQIALPASLILMGIFLGLARGY